MLGFHIYVRKRLSGTDAVVAYVRSIQILNLLIGIGIEDSYTTCDWLNQSHIYVPDSTSFKSLWLSDAYIRE